MSNTTTTQHHGRAIKFFRELRGLTQDNIADGLGDDWDQKRVSRLEEKEIVPDDIMEQVAQILKVPIMAIRNFDQEKAIQIISNTFHDHSIAYAGVNSPTFNPLDKYIEAMEDNKKLYEQLVQSEREKVELLERVLRDYQTKTK